MRKINCSKFNVNDSSYDYKAKYKIEKNKRESKYLNNDNKKNKILKLKKYYSYERHISNINIIDKNLKSINKNWENKLNYISPKNRDQKFLFNVQIDLTKLIDENSFSKDKPKKTFRFSKSSKKIINNNININNFSKDFFIIPKTKD